MSEKEKKPMWVKYDVAIKLRKELVGGWPKSPETRNALYRARGLDDLVEELPDPATLSEEERELLKEQVAQKSWTGFHQNGDGLYMESRYIKAMMKEAANVLKPIIGIKNYRSKVAERVFVDPHEIPLHKREADGMIERPIHVMTAKGPRTSLVIADYIMQPEISFTLRVLNDDLVTEEHLRTMLEYAQENGLGKDRSQDFGKFDLVSLDRV